MTVEQVIAELAKLPQDAIVMDFNSGMNVPVDEVMYDVTHNTVWIW